MKYKICSIICFTILMCIVFASAYEVPKIVPYVNDFAGVMTTQQINDLNILCDQIEQNSSYEIAVVIVPTTNGQDRIEFANKIGDQNGVGKKGKDNGIVLLWTMENEKGGAIATGRYAESIITDMKAGDIGRAARPLFDNGDYYGAFRQMIQAIQAEIAKDTSNSNSETLLGKNGDDLSIVGFIIIIIAVGFIIYGLSISPFSEIFEAGTGAAVLSSSRSSRSSSSSDSSSGGFSGGGVSFGGGGFGGGGASF